jgi:DNA (cytosine-5)-methyltransferase 1
LSNLTAVSLFAGVGGFDLALTRAGVKVVAAVEINEKCREVLGQRFPETKLFDDVKGVTGEQLRAAGFVPERGIITAGFPCQDLSVAGLRKGLAGERSGLFWEIVRLIDETQTESIILENVPGLLSSQQGKDMGIIITALVERGYGVCWRVLDSQNFGVPQRRRRVFIVASRGNHRRPVEVLFESDSSSGYLEESGQKRKTVATETERSVNQDNRKLNDKSLTATLLRMRGGKEGGGKGALVSEDKSLTLATGNDQTLFIFQCNRKDDSRIYETIAPTLGCYVGSIPLTFTSKQKQLASGKEVTNTITASLYHHGTVVNQDVADGHLIIDEPIVRKITPKECERLQGFPDDWTAAQADSHRYKMLGNAVSVPVVEWIIKRMVKLISE